MILATASTREYARTYVEALKAVGVPAGEIRVVCPGDEISGEVLRETRGLLLCGGADVDPARYGEETLPSAHVEAIPDRDAQEWSLIDAAREARIPVWGICRGLQVLNVYFGGTLWQDLPLQRPSGVEHSLREPLDLLAHPVRVTDPAAPLAERLRGEALVNSRHHQAVKRLARGLVTVAESPDGLIEAAILDDAGWWVRAVQWHAENLVALPEQRALWMDFVRATST
jgi:putative glutamine amidotransferase